MLDRTLRSALAPFALLVSFAATAQPAREYSAVTDARLVSPEARNWLMYRRTYDSWGYSPLDKITARNVGRARAGVERVDRARPKGIRRRRSSTTASCSSRRRSTKCSRSTRRAAISCGATAAKCRPTFGWAIRPTAASRSTATRSTWRRPTRKSSRSTRSTRQRRLGRRGRGLQRRLLHDARAARGARQDHGRRLGRRARHPRLRRRARRGNGQGGVEDLHDPGPRRARQRHVARRLVEDGRRAGLDHGQLRSRARTHLLGHGQPGPVDRRSAARRQPLHELRRRARRRDRQAPRPSPIPLERLVGLGRGLGAAADRLAARRPHGARARASRAQRLSLVPRARGVRHLVHLRAAVRDAERVHEHRSAHGASRRTTSRTSRPSVTRCTFCPSLWGGKDWPPAAYSPQDGLPLHPRERESLQHHGRRGGRVSPRPAVHGRRSRISRSRKAPTTSASCRRGT